MTFDSLVIGQGLAGTAVAWHLRWAGQRVLVVDRGDAATASRVAAGLITPITGQRLSKTWKLDEAYPTAVAFYHRVEAETGERVFVSREMVRLFADESERTAFEQRDNPSLHGIVGAVSPPLDPASFAAPHGGFAMASAGRLDVIRYLDASRAWFARDGGFRIADIDPTRDLELTPSGVCVPRLGVEAKQVIFCQGLAAGGHPWCGGIRFAPAKGEVLTLRVPGLAEDRVVHRGVWLAPVGGDVFLAGATYDRSDLTPTPTIRGREHIEGRLREFLRLPFEVIGHSAGIRPVVQGGKPVVGRHPQYSQFAFFNGLGSKGALLAPFFAARLVEQLTSAMEPPPTHRVRKPVRVTEQAHAAIRKVLRPGEIAIDATAGSGRDTVFLAELVGPTGRVFAFDVQPLAMERTAALLRTRGLGNVTLIREDHANLATAMPADCHGVVGAVLFHFGPLPGGDRSLTPAPESTVAGLRAALGLLRLGGVLTGVTTLGGGEVNRAMRGVLDATSGMGFEVRESCTDNGNATTSWLFVVVREAVGPKGDATGNWEA
jgi:glycine/D-amino acid oxidase-like deaminating enzyme